jgi:hypothetical protein
MPNFPRPNGKGFSLQKSVHQTGQNCMVWLVQFVPAYGMLCTDSSLLVPDSTQDLGSQCNFEQIIGCVK